MNLFLSLLPSIITILICLIYFIRNCYSKLNAQNNNHVRNPSSSNNKINETYDLKRFPYFDYKMLYPITNLEAQIEILKNEAKG